MKNKMEEDKDFLRQDNNYRSLKAFQKAECIYDVTFYFAHKFLKTGDRTIDQMIQAARSGKQNLAEGYRWYYIARNGVETDQCQSCIAPRTIVGLRGLSARSGLGAMEV